MNQRSSIKGKRTGKRCGLRLKPSLDLTHGIRILEHKPHFRVLPFCQEFSLSHLYQWFRSYGPGEIHIYIYIYIYIYTHTYTYTYGWLILLYGRKHLSEAAQLCLTLCNPVDCSLPVSSIYGLFQARILEWVAISFSRRSCRPRDQIQVSFIAGRLFTVWATREPLVGFRSSGDVCIPMVDSYCCMAETNTTL